MIIDWTKLEKDQLRKWLVGVLKEQPVDLKFEKKDGSVRKMKATLKSDMVVEYEKKTDKEKVVNEEVLSVFDLDKNEWRSFRLESLKEIHFTLGV
jgi:hypothetical protein